MFIGKIRQFYNNLIIVSFAADGLHLTVEQRLKNENNSQTSLYFVTIPVLLRGACKLHRQQGHSPHGAKRW